MSVENGRPSLGRGRRVKGENESEEAIGLGSGQVVILWGGLREKAGGDNLFIFGGAGVSRGDTNPSEND
jgi:hypothetical protein